MDALEFLKERTRMCLSHGTCIGCPLEEAKCTLGSSTSVEEYEKIIAAVEQWSKEHLLKTRQSVFLEQYPETQIDDTGVLSVCPAIISPAHRLNGKGCAHYHKKCSECCREFYAGGGVMDCFNHLCPLRQNTTSSCNRCDCLTCPNRCPEPIRYTVSNHTLTADEIARTTKSSLRGPSFNLPSGARTPPQPNSK